MFKKLLERFKAAHEDYVLIGMHGPEVMDAIEKEYHSALNALEKYVNKLEMIKRQHQKMLKANPSIHPAVKRFLRND